MPETESMTVTLSKEAANILRQHIDSCEFANEVAAVKNAVRALHWREPEWSDEWLRQEVLPALDEALEHPELCLTGDQMRMEIHGWLAAEKKAR